MTILLLAAGIVILVIGGEVLVRGAVAVAAGMGMSPLVIGIVIVGFGTSMPELVTSVEAALVDAPGVAVGNVVGSNICNILLILGLTALIQPVLTAKSTLRRDGVVLGVATILCLVVVMSGMVHRVVGVGFAAMLAAYVAHACVSDRRRVAADAEAEAGEAVDEDAVDIEAARSVGVPKALLLIACGLALMVFGAQLLVDAAVTLAERLGVSDAIIGLTLVALGTSLPELVTGVVAAVRGHGDVGFGNIVGRCIPSPARRFASACARAAARTKRRNRVSGGAGASCSYPAHGRTTRAASDAPGGVRPRCAARAAGRASASGR